MLCANLALNSFTNTHSFQIALSDRPGFIPLTELPGHTGSSRFSQPGEQVQTATLDSFGIPTCHLIKLDVGEVLPLVLRGALQTLQRCRAIVYVVSDRPIAPDAVTDLVAAGYRLYHYRPYLYSGDNYFQQGRNVFGDDTLHNIIGFHAQHNLTVSGLEPFGS